MVVLSLFDGMSCGQVAFDRLGIKFDGEENKYFASEIKKHAIKLTQYHYPNTIQIGDVTKVHYENGILYTENGEFKTPIDIIIGGSPCFVAGTLVLTNKGYKKIEDIKRGDYVLTHNNRFKKVLTTMIKSSNDIYELNTITNNKVLGTAEHPFYIISKELQNFSNPYWKELKNLKNNDYVGIAINKNEIIPNNKIINKYIEQSTLWKLIGKFINNGVVYNDKIYICFNNDKKEICNFLKNENITYCTNENLISIHNDNLVKYLKEECNIKTLLDLPNKQLKIVLDSLLNESNVFSNKNLLLAISQCYAKVYNKPYKIEKKENRYFFIPCENNEDLFFKDGYIWSKISSISKTNLFELVYNLEVEDDNSYTVENIIVHNCQNFSTARATMYKIDGLEGDKSKLFYEYLRILHEVNPKYFLLENVKMKKESEQQLNDYMGVKGIHINSRLVSYQNRPRIYWTNIPNVTIPKDKNINFQDFKEKDPEECKKYKLKKTPSRIKMWNNGKNEKGVQYCPNVTNSEKIHCITRKQDRAPNSGLIECEDFARFLTRKELEQGQTLPIGYTDLLSYNQMQDLCGDGWTIDVITHILKNIK